MNTTELLKAMQDSSLDHTLSVKRKELYLRCLNRAYKNLYASNLVGNPSYNKLGYAIFDSNYKDKIGIYNVPNDVMNFKNIYNNIGVTLNRFVGSPCDEKFKTNEFIEMNNKIYTDNNNATDYNENKALHIYYLPKCKKLVEVVEDNELETNEPIFLEELHNQLIDKALLYLADGNVIFFETIANINNRIQNGNQNFKQLNNYNG